MDQQCTNNDFDDVRDSQLVRAAESSSTTNYHHESVAEEQEPPAIGDSEDDDQQQQFDQFDKIIQRLKGIRKKIDFHLFRHVE